MLWSKAVAALAFLLLMSFASAMTDQAPVPPGVGIQVEAFPRIGTVGDPIRIDLDIATPPGYRVDIPKPAPQVGDFSIIEFFPGPTVSEPDKVEKFPNSAVIQNAAQLHHRARIVAAIYKAGRFSFPSIQLLVNTGEGKTIALSSPPVEIEIQSVLGGKDQDLKDLKKQAEIKEPFRWALWLTIALAVCSLGVSGWLLWQKYRNRSLPHPLTPTRDPFELAETDLRNLLALNLPEKGFAKEFYVLLSEIARRILESGYAIHTSEQTTSEIIDLLRRRPGFQTERIERIESFLLRCDVVKFAKYVPSKSENDTAADNVFWILAESKKCSGQ